MINLNSTSPIVKPSGINVVSNLIISGSGVASVNNAASARTSPYPEFLS